MQDQFIASLELPTYHNFSSYSYLDLLDTLSFRIMVIDHIIKNRTSADKDTVELMKTMSAV